MLILCLLKSINLFLSKLITSVPSTETTPDVGSIKRLICLIKVDLPEPDKPIHTNVSPSSILSDTLSKPTVCPVFSKTSSLVAPSCTIGRIFFGEGPNIL